MHPETGHPETGLGHHWVALDRCMSTNDEARKRAVGGAVHGTVVVSDVQIKGRGRLGRNWYSPKGKHVYLSVILRPNWPVKSLPLVSLATGVALFELVKKEGLLATLKWPNDIYVGDKKLAGILCESSARGKRVDFVIVGIGLNVAAEDFPVELQATSLENELGKRCEVSTIAKKIVRSLALYIPRDMQSQDVETIVQQWNRRFVPTKVSGDFGQGIAQGIAQGVDRLGRLIVVKADGRDCRVASGTLHWNMSAGTVQDGL